MPVLNYADGFFSANGYPILNAKAPFLNRSDNRIVKGAKSALFRTPYQAMTCYNGRARVRMHLADHISYNLYAGYAQNLTCHGIWKTEDASSPIFRAKALEDLQKKLSRLPSFMDHVQIVMTLMAEQYDFDEVWVDSKILSEDFEWPCAVRLISPAVKWHIPEDSKRHEILNRMLEHYESIPLISLPEDLVASITADIVSDRPDIREGAKVLIVSWTNHALAGWVYREWLAPWCPDSLALCMFLNRHRDPRSFLNKLV